MLYYFYFTVFRAPGNMIHAKRLLNIFSVGVTLVTSANQKQGTSRNVEGYG